MAARKRLALARTMAASRIRNGRVYFCLAAWRAISKSSSTSGCVSKSCSCGCCLATAVLLLRLKLLGRSPIKVLLARELTFGNVAYGNVVHAVADPRTSHDDLLLLKAQKLRPIIGMTPRESRAATKIFTVLMGCPGRADHNI